MAAFTTISEAIIPLAKSATAPSLTSPPTDTRAAATYEELPPHEVGDLIQHAKASPYTSLQQLSETDVGTIWVRVCQFISATIADKKGVNIPHLGIFSLTRGTPVFLLSEKFASRHRLRFHHQIVDGSVPVVALNYARIAQQTDYDRDLIELCVRELLQTLEQRVGDQQGISLEFFGIGRLVVKGGKVRFAFYRIFLEHPGIAMTASQIASARSALQSRGQTVASFAAHEGVRPHSSSTPTPRLLRTPNLVGLFDLGNTSPEAGRPLAIEESEEARLASAAAKPPRSLAPISRVATPSVSEDEIAAQQKLAQRAVNSLLFLPHESSGTARDKAEDWAYSKGPIPTLTRPAPPSSLTPPVSHGATYALPPRPASVAGVSCSHANKLSGGRLCYVCHQRSLSHQDPSIQQTLAAQDLFETLHTAELSDARKKKADAIEAMLEKAKKETARRVAQFNLSATLAKPPKEKDAVPQANLFAYRPVTAPEQIRENNARFASDLVAQHVSTTARKRDAELTEALRDRERITADTEADKLQAEEETRRRLQLREQYKQQLDMQRTHKLQVDAEKDRLWSAVEAASARGRVLLGPEMYAEDDWRRTRKAEIAKDAYMAQVEAEATRRSLRLQEKLKEQEEDMRNIEEAKSFARQQIIAEAQAVVVARAELEASWAKAAEEKKAREKEYEQFRLLAPTMGVLDQSMPYNRCARCQRDLTNTGTTHVCAAQHMT